MLLFGKIVTGQYTLKIYQFQRKRNGLLLVIM